MNSDFKLKHPIIYLNKKLHAQLRGSTYAVYGAFYPVFCLNQKLEKMLKPWRIRVILCDIAM